MRHRDFEESNNKLQTLLSEHDHDHLAKLKRRETILLMNHWRALNEHQCCLTVTDVFY